MVGTLAAPVSLGQCSTAVRANHVVQPDPSDPMTSPDGECLGSRHNKL
jgi:hypothetical protein